MNGVVLAADVGGTNAKIALASFASGHRSLIKHSNYASRAYGTFDEVIAAFLREPEVAPHESSITGACFAVAGPIENGRAKLTNLTWRIDELEIARRFGFKRVKVINDFAAAGLGVDELDDSDLLTLQAGSPVERGERAIVGAGTGLGVGWLSWSENGYRVRASEGGHIDFSPADASQTQLLQYLAREFSHVSYERVVSGPGLVSIFHYLRKTGGVQPDDQLLRAMKSGDAGSAITEFALTKRDAVAQRALDLFVEAYGAFAGSMALISLAHGGVYIAGGIAPKIATKLADGGFMRAFTAKGRFQNLLETIPVNVVMNDHVGLFGALAEANRR